MKQRYSVLLVAAAGLALATIGSAVLAGAPPQRPNILWITCEDTSPNLGCYGDPYAKTANLDRLATQGIRYTNAFSIAGVCAPSRSCLITGVYPTSLGSHHMRSKVTLPDHIKCFPEYLRAAGYYCSNNVKTDYNFPVPKGAWDECSGRAHWRKRGEGQPFFSVFNITTTHESRIRASRQAFAKLTRRLTPQERHDPAKATPPPFLPGGPVVRNDWARYHDLVTAMDKQVGDLLEQLREDGLDDKTIVFFFADHGVGLPRAKQWIFDAGIHVPLIIRFPDGFQSLAPARPGAAVDRLVSFVDFAPTVLSLAGVEIPEHMQGTAFLGKQAGEPRQYVFAIRDRMDERYDMMRAVRSKKYKYHRNYLPHLRYAPWLDYMEKMPTMQEWRRLEAEGKLQGPPALFMRDTKPVEELYDIQADPHELQNLAGRPEHQKALEQMRRVHLEWVRRTRDLGLLPEHEMHARSKGMPQYQMARQKDSLFPLEKTLEAALLIDRGEEALPDLIDRLDDADSGVRFWAANGLCYLGAKAEPATPKLTKALSDPSPDVRIAAAEVLCRLNHPDAPLPVLVEALEHESPWVRLYSANVLDRIGPQALPALESIKKAAKGKDMYIRWVFGHTVKTLTD